jgi:hypothetical protein
MRPADRERSVRILGVGKVATHDRDLRDALYRLGDDLGKRALDLDSLAHDRWKLAPRLCGLVEALCSRPGDVCPAGRGPLPASPGTVLPCRRPVPASSSPLRPRRRPRTTEYRTCAPSYTAWGDSLLTSPRSPMPGGDSRRVSPCSPRSCASSLMPDPDLQTSPGTPRLAFAALETSSADTPTTAASGSTSCAPSPGTAALLCTSRDDSSRATTDSRMSSPTERRGATSTEPFETRKSPREPLGDSNGMPTVSRVVAEALSRVRRGRSTARKRLVGRAGLEPATYGLKVRSSTD